MVPLTILLTLLLSPLALAQVLQATPRSCLSSSAPLDQLLNLTAVYAQFDQGQLEPGQKANGVAVTGAQNGTGGNAGAGSAGSAGVLRMVLVGETLGRGQGYSNFTNLLATVVVNSQILTFPIYSNQTALCSSIRTAGATVGSTSNGAGTISNSGCPYGPGEIALGISLDVGSSYPLTTITTQIVVLDSSNPPQHLACYNLDFTPYYPQYFAYHLIHYFPIGLIALYLLTYMIARSWASHSDFIHENETQLASSLTLKLSSGDAGLSKRKMWGTIWFGAWAGRQVVGSGSLRRFVTVEVREIWTVVVWWSLIGTVAVSWPGFAYPIFVQAAWATLIYNSTLPFTQPAVPPTPSAVTLPPAFASQIADPTSPLYLQSSLPNVLLDLETSRPGIESWARVLGVRSQDLWSICAFTFFSMCAIIIVTHLIFAGADALLDRLMPSRTTKARVLASGKGKVVKESPAGGKERPSVGMDESAIAEESEDGFIDGEEEYAQQPRPEDDFPSLELHFALLQGNLTRVLFLFHLPLTLFSVYQLSLYSSSPRSSFVLALLVLLIVCIAIPSFLLYRIHLKPVSSLFTSLPTLLSLGPLYNTYSDECTMFSGVSFVKNLIIGIIIGGAQNSGITQAIVILLVEVAFTLITSLWLPWADNSALAFLLSISRIVMAVLLIVLSPSVAVADPASSWLAYIILLFQGLVAALLMGVLVCKIVELGIRLVRDVPFDESKSSRQAGVFGALQRWDRGGTISRDNRGRARSARERREQYGGHRGGFESQSTVGNSARMLTGRSAAHSRASSGTTSYGDPASYGRSTYSSGPSSPRPEFATIPGPWNEEGYVRPGAYSNKVHPSMLRSGPTWNEVIVTPAATPLIVQGSAAFSRVGGGKASSSNPYQLANIASPTSAAYPPYPSTPPMLNSPPLLPNPRRMSQSAIIEMAGAAPISRHTSRPSLTIAGSSSLLSNSVTPYEYPAVVVPPRSKPGLLDRLKGKKRNDDSSSDDDDMDDGDASDVPAKSRKWGLGRLGRKGKEEEKGDNVDADAGTAEKGFVVTRKPRPRTPASSSPSTGSIPLATVPPTPVASITVEPPSRSGSFEGLPLE